MFSFVPPVTSQPPYVLSPGDEQAAIIQAIRRLVVLAIRPVYAGVFLFITFKG
jgi:hypothetical protein